MLSGTETMVSARSQLALPWRTSQVARLARSARLSRATEAGFTDWPTICPRTTEAALIIWACSSLLAPMGVAMDQRAQKQKRTNVDTAQTRRSPVPRVPCVFPRSADSDDITCAAVECQGSVGTRSTLATRSSTRGRSPTPAAVFRTARRSPAPFAPPRSHSTEPPDGPNRRGVADLRLDSSATSCPLLSRFRDPIRARDAMLAATRPDDRFDHQERNVDASLPEAP